MTHVPVIHIRSVRRGLAPWHPRGSVPDYCCLVWEQIAVVAVSAAVSLGSREMLTMLAILAGPIVVSTILVIVFFEVRDAWNRNRLK